MTKPVRDHRTLWIMTVLGFAAGLPNVLVIGSLGTWLANAGLSFGTIAVLSWIGLFYAFKFLWAPAIDAFTPPMLTTIGRRRAWMVVCQVVIAACLFGLVAIDPRQNIGLFAALAALAGFFSASQDVVIDAWRIEVASDAAPIDDLSTRYQFGYRTAAIVGGAVALLLADIWKTAADAAAGWPSTFAIMAVLMALCIAATLAAPEPLLAPREKTPRHEASPEVRHLRRMAVLPVAAGWAAAGIAIAGFMIYSLQPNPALNALAFRDAAIPWILLITVGAPVGMAFWLVRKGAVDDEIAGGGVVDALYARVLAPLADIVRRYWVWAIPVLLLAMTYRIADSIWGALANPFYIKVMGYSNSDIAVASKMVGVLMTLGGIALGALALSVLGRMQALVIGAILAAVTNLLYADLATGGAWMQGFLNITGLGVVLSTALAGFVNGVNGMGGEIFREVTLGDALTKLTGVIALENLAGGFASAVYTAWLSSVVNKQFAAVQFALLSSLALLIGVIFRPALGSYVDVAASAGVAAQAERFEHIFVFATAVGGVAVALAALEWWRQRSTAKAGTAPVDAPAE